MKVKIIIFGLVCLVMDIHSAGHGKGFVNKVTNCFKPSFYHPYTLLKNPSLELSSSESSSKNLVVNKEQSKQDIGLSNNKNSYGSTTESFNVKDEKETKSELKRKDSKSFISSNNSYLSGLPKDHVYEYSNLIDFQNPQTALINVKKSASTTAFGIEKVSNNQMLPKERVVTPIGLHNSHQGKPLPMLPSDHVYAEVDQALVRRNSVLNKDSEYEIVIQGKAKKNIDNTYEEIASEQKAVVTKGNILNRLEEPKEVQLLKEKIKLLEQERKKTRLSYDEEIKKATQELREAESLNKANTPKK